MKTIILIIALITAFSSSSQIAKDKQLHLIAGATISAVTYVTVMKITKNQKKAFIYSLSASVLAGIGKELLDESKYDGFDSQDMFAASIGGLTISTTFTIFTDNHKIEPIY